ncbi:MAG TPA: hypothetical protein VJ063_04370, partial [Verrucomicrobiae bacterium]|nr:hypothetical protein [Verrucomicrobiae bacterium]
MFAVVYISDFYLQATLRVDAPGSRGRPVALIDATAMNPTILQFTPAAREMGVHNGMTVTQAMARCPQIIIKPRSAAQEQAANAALLDCAWAFSPHVEATEDGICTLDLKGHNQIDYEQFA